MRKVDIPGKKPQKAFSLIMILIAILFIFIFGLIYILLVSAPPNLHKHTGPVDKQEVEIAPKTVEAENLRHDLTQLNDNAAKAKDVENLRRDLTQLNDDAAKAKDVESLAADLNNLDEKSAKTEDIQTMKVHVDSLDGKLVSIVYSIKKAEIHPQTYTYILLDGLATRVDGLATRVEGLTPRVEGLAPRVDGLATRVDSLATSVNKLDNRVDRTNNKVERLTEDLKKLDEATPKDVQNLEKRVNGLEASQVLNSHLVQRLTDELKKLREEAAKDVDIKTLTDDLKKLREEAAKTKDVEVEEETDIAKDLKARVDHLMTAETTNHITIQDLTTRVDDLKTAQTTNTKTIQDLTTRVGKLDAMSDKRKMWFAAVGGHKMTCDDKVIFGNVRTNMGSRYDANTGIFTAPYKGAYFFTLAYRSHGEKIHLDVYKEKDGNREWLMFLFDTTNIKGKDYMASSSRMVDLEHEEKVYVIAYSDHGFTDTWSSVFSGFLVHPM
ncbi:uncharacterized protein LOC129191437 [Dunckerocampus dactyliophorus]|uniref:uncharacterized protein LOC129191437 n=1 Tax=Dunckerocampus dactyliophorus TaxID=161453 RepID=UPI002406B851|nr:uncharacterized protein LOC129191437 [Dunckerocampus dactyliophorus]